MILLTLFLGLAPDSFAIYGKAWIEAIFAVLDILIAKIGVEALAALAVWQNIKTRALKERLEEQNARLDRQGKRLDAVALATTTPTATVKIQQPEGESIPMHETG